MDGAERTLLVSGKTFVVQAEPATPEGERGYRVSIEREGKETRSTVYPGCTSVEDALDTGEMIVRGAFEEPGIGICLTMWDAMRDLSSPGVLSQISDDDIVVTSRGHTLVVHAEPYQDGQQVCYHAVVKEVGTSFDPWERVVASGCRTPEEAHGTGRLAIAQYLLG